MKKLILIAALLVHGMAFAQTGGGQRADLSYNYVELRYVDVDNNGGDGFRLNGSFDLQNNWLMVGGVTLLDFNGNVDVTTAEVGAGYVWSFSKDFDLLSTLRLVRAEVDTPGGSANDTGFAFSAGARGWVAPRFEVRGSVNHINLDNNDTYLEVAGDYHFTDRVSAGASLEFAGDDDILTIGARWYFQ